jgi:radical SAM enzyme (TIGR01210 family)
MTDLERLVGSLYREFGPPKAMGASAPATDRPHFFLHRNFLGEQDLAILFNTKRCRYQCSFCALPAKSSRSWIPADQVIGQFQYVADELRHSLGVLERVTIANEGSVFDEATFPVEALTEIVGSLRALPRVRRIVLETRLEFVRRERIDELRELVDKQFNILTGFETHDPRLREEILGKRQTLDSFAGGLDEIAAAGAELTAYVLFKPEPTMTDAEAFAEAEASIDYLHRECASRRIPLQVRLNPLYVAKGTALARRIKTLDHYLPPRLSDVVALGERKRAEGLDVYLGLTSEGLSDPDDTYRGREDFSRSLLKRGIIMNGQASTAVGQDG